MLDSTPQGRYIRLTEENASQSPLLRLPSEIRHMIYEYVLGGKRIDIYSVEQGRQRVRIGTIVELDHSRAPPWICHDTEYSQSGNSVHYFSVLSVCRQTYSETRLLPFSLNLFWVNYSRHGPGDQLKSLQMFSSLQLEAVKAIFCRWCALKLRDDGSVDLEHLVSQACHFPQLEVMCISHLSRKGGVCSTCDGAVRVPDGDKYKREVEGQARALIGDEVRVIWI